MNNYYKRGPATNQANATRIMLTADRPGEFPGTQRYYFSGNVMPGVFDENNQEKGRTPNGEEEKMYDELYYKQWVDEPFFPSYAKIETAREAYKSVLSDVGANQPVFDDHDLRMVDETLNGTYHYVGSRSGHYGLIDSEQDCGGYEDYGNEVRPAAFDTDRDGLPDWWERLLGTNPNSAEGNFTDSNADPDGDGFTLLEDYLNWLADTHLCLGLDGRQDVDLPSLFAGYTASPEYKAEVVSGTAMISVDGGRLNIKAAGAGLTAVDVTVTDGEGSTMTRRVNVAVTADVPSSIRQEKANGQPSAAYTTGGVRISQPAKGVHIEKNRKYIVK